MIIGFGNNVVSSLAADITAGQTTIQVMPGAGAVFAELLSQDYANGSNTPKIYAKITLTDAKETVFEVCHLTAVNNDMLTVVRGQEGTTAKGWSLNDVIANFATRGSENQFIQIEQLQSGHYTSGVAGGTANALTISLPATYFVNGSTDWTLRTPLVIYPSQNNSGASTLQLTMGGRVLGTFKLYKGNKAELVANDILKDVALVCLMDKTRTFFNVANPGAIYAGLGTAAFLDAQTSKDDITTGRLLVNGGALALRTTLAGPGRPVTDFDDLPANSVSFGYDNATNTPGFTGSVLDYAGSSGNYRVQLAAQYNGNGNRIAFRTRNGDSAGVWNAWGELYHTRNKPTAGDVGALPITGGTLKGALAVVQNGPGVTLQSSASGQGVYLIGKNYDGANTWYVGRGGSSFNVSLYNYKGANGINLNEDGSIALNLANGKTFTANGQIVPSTYANFDARYQTKGDYTPTGTAYTKAESDARYGVMNGFRRGGQQLRNPTDAFFGNWESPAGCVVTGITMENRSDGRKLGVYYRQMQYLNKQTGAWVNVGD